MGPDKASRTCEEVLHVLIIGNIPQITEGGKQVRFARLLVRNTHDVYSTGKRDPLDICQPLRARSRGSMQHGYHVRFVADLLDHLCYSDSDYCECLPPGIDRTGHRGLQQPRFRGPG